MGLLDRVEKSVEGAFNGVFSRVFHAQIKPVDVASAIRQSMEDNVINVSPERTLAPNQFTVSLATADFDEFDKMGAQALATELAREAINHATTQEYYLAGPVEVKLTAVSSQVTGTIDITTLSKKGSATPSFDATATPQEPVIEIDGTYWRLSPPATVLGRGSEADIVVADNGVSRRHLELRVTPTGVIATDLGSTNGTFVEGNKIDAVTLLDGNQITIGRTTINFWTSTGDTP